MGREYAGKRKEMVKGRRVQQMYVEGMCVRSVSNSCVDKLCVDKAVCE